MIGDKKKGRNLSEIERGAVAYPIRSTLDLDKVIIVPRRWTPLTPKNVTVARGYKIYYPDDPGPQNDSFHLAHLVHEIVHVWQYMYWDVSLYSPRWLNRRYHYELIEGDQFLDFGLEQQAAMFEDHFRLKRKLSMRWATNDPSFELMDHVLTTSTDDQLPPFM